MSVVVFQFAHSPYCIPITRALEALGVEFSTCEVSNADRREVIERTEGAYYQVPVLELNGQVIFESGPDSLDIARAVDRHFGGGRLFPACHEGLQRIVIAHIENEVEGVTFRLTDPPYLAELTDRVARTQIIRHKERKFGRGCVAAWSEQREELTRAASALLEPYDLTLRHRPFLFGESPIFADFALFGILGNLTYGGYNRLPDGCDALAEWEGRMKEFRYASDRQGGRS